MEKETSLTDQISLRIEQHRKELSEIEQYLSEQKEEKFKELPRRSATILEAYIEEAENIKALIQPSAKDQSSMILTAIAVLLCLAIAFSSCSPQYGCPALKSSNTAGFAK